VLIEIHTLIFIHQSSCDCLPKAGGLALGLSLVPDYSSLH